jgi:hypothetical protein
VIGTKAAESLVGIRLDLFNLMFVL